MTVYTKFLTPSLKKGNLNLAIVQNDVAYYIYEGITPYQDKKFQGFSTSLPLFTEYVQVIVRKDSPIKSFSELKHKKIAIGPLESGSRRNGLDLLNEIGVKEAKNTNLLSYTVADSISKLKAKEVDAMIYTGATLPREISNSPGAFKLLPISKGIITKLTSTNKYYKSAEMDGNGNPKSKINTLAVTAYLVFSNRVSESQARKVTEVLMDMWPDLKSNSKNYQLVKLKKAVLRLPVPLHAGAKDALIDAGILYNNIFEYLVSIIIALAMIYLVFWVRNQGRLYDRFGNKHKMTAVTYLNHVGIFLLIIAALFVVVVVVVIMIQHYEAVYSQLNNKADEFAKRGFWGAMRWMFLFMGAGHEDKGFPQSSEGALLAGILPFIGLSTLFSLLWAGISKYERVSSAHKRGAVIRSVKDHILVCGWNEKVPGLVFALTSADAPSKRQVVIVAELEGDMPLEQYDFNPKYVSYFRGDSADKKVLESVHVKDASVAVIVAGIHKRKGQNIRSILCALTLKETHRAKSDNGLRRHQHLFVAAEVLFEENRELFELCQADALVHADTIMNRLVAQCCVSEFAIDFVLDMLTYDEYAGLNSVSVLHLNVAGLVDGMTEFGKWQGWRNAVGTFVAWLSIKGEKKPAGLVGRKLGEIRAILANEGINVVGMTITKEKGGGLIDKNFDDSSATLLLSKNDEEAIFSEKHTLLFISDDQRDVWAANWRVAAGNVDVGTPVTRTTQALAMPKAKSVLLVGDYARCEQICKILKSVPWVQASILTTDKTAAVQQDIPVFLADKLTSEKAWQIVAKENFDEVVFMSKSAEVANEVNLTQDRGEIDANVILAAKFARRYLTKPIENNGVKTLKIVAEMLGRDNLGLFHDAGVDVVIPSNLLVERMLTKLVYNRGQVCEFLMALMALDDNVHFLTFCLNDEEYGHLLGKTFLQLTNEMPYGIQFLGVIPAADNQREKLKNKEKDFSYHFLASQKLAKNIGYRSQVGDHIALIVDRRGSVN
ncbi:MAG: TAXI family TRAP transporter solute-binding subunit [Gallionellaceae bacterium]